MFEDITYESANGRATITLNRPQIRNALRTQTFEELTSAFVQASDDATIGVVVLTGSGKSFCAGGDANTQNVRTGVTGRVHIRRAIALASAIRNTPKPVIAAVNGDAVGGGHELQLLCDLTIAAKEARFGQVEARMGSLPIIGGTQFLPRVVGERRAREMLMLGRLYTAHEALEMGLVNRVVDVDQLGATVDEWCQQLLAKSPQGLRNIKTSLNHATDLDFYAAMIGGGELLAAAYDTEEFREGPRAFLEKRPPDFSRFRRNN